MNQALPDDLAAVLDQHSVPLTTDGLLAAFERWGYLITMIGPNGQRLETRWYVGRDRIDPPQSYRSQFGPTPLIALARAFAAMVESNE